MFYKYKDKYIGPTGWIEGKYRGTEYYLDFGECTLTLRVGRGGGERRIRRVAHRLRVKVKEKVEEREVILHGQMRRGEIWAIAIPEDWEISSEWGEVKGEYCLVRL